MSSFDRLAWQRDYRIKNGNSCTKKYERTKKGKLMRTYRNMQSRVKGIVKKKAHLYVDLDILPKGDFYEWSLSSEDFNTLYEDWVASGYNKRLSPSIDRIDVEKGYTPDNMRWLTHSENSSNGAKNRWKNG